MIRVCHIATMTNYGGVEQIIQDYLVQKKDSKIKHYLVCPSYDYSIIERIVESGTDYYLPKRLFRYDVLAIFKVSKWVKRNQIDVIHSYNAFANNFANLVSVISGIPMICSEHGTVWNTRGLRKWLDKFAYERSKVATANSSASKMLLQRKYGLRSNKIEKLVNPVPFITTKDSKSQIKEELEIQDSRIVIGTIARLVQLKGIDIFIRSAHEVLKVRKDCLFLIVGGGQEYEQLVRLSSDLGISESIIFTGWRNDARRLLKSIDIYVNCSIRESFGNVMIEAGFEKIPVIAPNVDGIPEAVIHQKTGILVDPSEPLEIFEGIPSLSVINGELKRPLAVSPTNVAREIIKFIDSPEKRMKFGEAGFRHSFEFSMEKYISSLSMIYNKFE